MGSIARPLMTPVSRRTFLVASGCGVAGLTLGSGGAAASPIATPSAGGKAKSTILFFLSGGASHLDMWDLKPAAPAEYRGEFNSIATSAPGVRLCEHLPLLAKQAHHLALVNSVKASINTNDHHAGYYHNLTGHIPDATFLSLGNNRTPMADDWPFMGSVVAAKRPPHATLPNLIALPHKEGAPTYTRPGQFAARLGVEFDAMYVDGSLKEPLKFQAPALMLDGSVSAVRLGERRALLTALDAARPELEQVATARTWNAQQQRAFALLLSSNTAAAFNVESEPPQVRERYGETLNGMGLLVARRLVEAGVPFVTVFWRSDESPTTQKKCGNFGGWDTHGNNFVCLKDYLLPAFDRAFSALIEDLAQSGLLDTTLLLVTSEMGRKPKIGDGRSGGPMGAGRDHWTHCLTDVFAGGGIRGGQTYGASDRLGEYPADRIVTPGDVTKTVYKAMGIADLEAVDKQDRPYNLLADCQAIEPLF